ncbi:hypothetical protein [uncultured Campylobacter sp.]|nr:hypothetical protein [uncultured Campylobacter sp.]
MSAVRNFKLIGGADKAAGTNKRCQQIKFNEQADASSGGYEQI